MVIEEVAVSSTTGVINNNCLGTDIPKPNNATNSCCLISLT